MIRETFKTSGALRDTTVTIFQTRVELGPYASDVRLVVTPRHPSGRVLLEKIIEDNSAALDALANETREVRKR